MNIVKKISVRFPDTLPLGPQPAEAFTRGAMRWYWTSLVDGPTLLRLLADGDGSSGRGQPAASPPFPDPPQTWRTAAGFGANSSAPSRTAATPPRPRSTAASPLSHLFFFCWRPPRAATGGLRYFLLPDLLGTAIPPSSEGSLTACPSFLPGFGTNVMKFLDREEGGGNRRTLRTLIK